MANYSLVVIGCSWGGFHSLREIFNVLPGDFAVPIVVAQHRLAQGPDGLHTSLQSASRIPIADVMDKEPLLGGAIYLAPSDYHTIVEGKYLALSTEEVVQFARPSIDVLFESAANSYGNTLIAVILTGANEDGAEGLRRVKELGGYTIVQDPKSAIRREMPEAALAKVRPDRVLTIEQIGPHLVELCSSKVGGDDGRP
ncbi:MAG: chemotaxis protein CheB [Actinobacteria bacterium]|nr:chemotaxis protein CheB [Actinomycetota bacterium]